MKLYLFVLKRTSLYLVFLFVCLFVMFAVSKLFMGFVEHM